MLQHALWPADCSSMLKDIGFGQVSGVVVLAIMATTVAVSPVGAQTNPKCGEAPDGYNLIESDARVIIGTPGPDWICAGPSKNTIRGKGGNDIIYGGDGNDVIYGGYGNDLISGQAGDDRITAGGGADYVTTGDGNNTVLAGQGHDRVFGGIGRDHITGGSGDDTLNGGDGHDILIGNQGRDRLVGDTGDDRLLGGVGNDTLDGDSGDDVLIGGDQNDRLDGSVGNDVLRGLGGNDSLISGHGNDDLDGGPGNDVLDYDGNGNKTVFGGSGIDECAIHFVTPRDEIGCEDWSEIWFDNDRIPAYEWLVVEHHVDGSDVVPSGMVRVGVDNWGIIDRTLDNDRSVPLKIRSLPDQRVVRSFSEELVEVENEYGTVDDRTFRKQMSAATVRQGRMVEVRSETTGIVKKLEVHLTGASYDSVTDSIVVTGSPGKEPTLVMRNAVGGVLAYVHTVLDANGEARVGLGPMPFDAQRVDVLRIDGTGDYEIFEGLVLNTSLELRSGTGSVSLVDAPSQFDGSVEVGLLDGDAVVATMSATAAADWTVDFGSQATNGRTLRATMPSGRTRTMTIGSVEVTAVSSDDPQMTGTGPAGWMIEVALWDWLMDDLEGSETMVDATISTDVQPGGTWGGSPNVDFFVNQEFSRGRVVAIDADGDRIITGYEGADFTVVG